MDALSQNGKCFRFSGFAGGSSAYKINSFSFTRVYDSEKIESVAFFWVLLEIPYGRNQFSIEGEGGWGYLLECWHVTC